MVPVEPDIVVSTELFLLGPAAAGAVKASAGWGIKCEGESILGFDKVSDEATTDDEVNEAKDVGGEDKDEDDVENALPPLGAAGGVVLGSERSVEALVLRNGEGGDCGGVVPVVDEGSINCAHEEGGPGENSEGFGNGRERGIENVRSRDQLSQEPCIGCFAVRNTRVQAQGQCPIDCYIDPIFVQDSIGSIRVGSMVGKMIFCIFAAR